MTPDELVLMLYEASNRLAVCARTLDATGKPDTAQFCREADSSVCLAITILVSQRAKGTP